MSQPLPSASATDPLSTTWRALSDPTRRAMLDLLRPGPMTTGMLAESFPQGRCAVMKHLEVLVGAGLVVVRRQGRERWNYLNAVPLQLMYERWVRPFEASWAAPLSRFKDALERPSTPLEDPRMPQDTVAPAAAGPRVGIAQVELEIRIAASASRVWNALTEQVELWWPSTFFASSNPLRMRFDVRLGGHLYEEGANGGGVVWYTVIALEPGNSITLAGHLTPQFGGPAQTILRLALRPQGAETVLELSDAVLGNVSDRTAASNEEGWREIFQHAFKKFVEQSVEPVR